MQGAERSASLMLRLAAGTRQVLRGHRRRGAFEAAHLRRDRRRRKGSAARVHRRELERLAGSGSQGGVSRRRHGDDAIDARRDRIDILRDATARFAAAPVVHCNGHPVRTGLIDFRYRRPALAGRQNRFRHARTDGVVLIRRQRDRRQDADDRNDDHQFDQCETLLNTLHSQLLSG